jgi:hypothetical protein
MTDIPIPPFFIGQKIICIKGRKGKYSEVIKDQTYIVGECIYCENCKVWWVGVLKQSGLIVSICPSCHVVVPASNKYYYYGAELFAPIEENFQSISFKECIEKEQVVTSIN